jgi:hypothetical protein
VRSTGGGHSDDDNAPFDDELPKTVATEPIEPPDMHFNPQELERWLASTGRSDAIVADDDFASPDDEAEGLRRQRRGY